MFLGPDKETMKLGYACESKKHTNAAKKCHKTRLAPLFGGANLTELKNN